MKKYFFGRGYTVEIAEDYTFFQISQCVCRYSLKINTKEYAIDKVIQRVDELIRRDANIETTTEKDIEKELQNIKQDLIEVI